MAEQEYQHRPHGELMVVVDRPLNRFGLAVTFGVALGGGVWVGKVMEDGSIMYALTERGIIPQPTFFISDEELRELRRAIDQAPMHYPEDARTEHLADTIRTRDRLLVMVEQEWTARTETGGSAHR